MRLSRLFEFMALRSESSQMSCHGIFPPGTAFGGYSGVEHPIDWIEQRLRDFTTSKYISSSPLSSEPQPVAVVPLKGAEAVHKQRYVPVRDADSLRHSTPIKDSTCTMASLSASPGAARPPSTNKDRETTCTPYGGRSKRERA